jgi:uncharacterized protein with NRDE domain
MCLILFAYRQHTEYDLILTANRDEFFARETASLAFWEDAPDVLAGRDLEKGGTWLGITRHGRFAAITNYRDANSPQKDAASRGHLVSEYLRGTDTPQQYLKSLQITAERYNGFNLLVGDEQSLFYFSNREMKISELQPGLYGLSNHLLETPWPKVERGKRLLEVEIGRNPLAPEPLLDILCDRHIPADGQLPDTGVSLDWERTLSPIFISSDHYGTRSSTLLLISRNGGISMTERVYLDHHTPASTQISIPRVTPLPTQNIQ